ncbi:retrovirus-related pol polyprotein from transposon TNT 1-94 [Tanacetum coccineum]
MDSIIPLGQKNTLAEYMILSGADNRPPMLDNDLYDSWKSIMELYMQNREHERMILESVENGLLIWPTIEENGSSYNNPRLQQQFSPSQYGSIHPTQHYSSTYPSQPQFNHSSVPPSYPYQSQMNHQTSSVAQIAYQSPQVTTQPMIESPLVDSSFVVPVFTPGDDLIACLNKAMAFLMVSNATSSGGNNASGQAKVIKCYNYQGKGHMARQCTQPKRPRNAAWYKETAMLAEAREAGQILNEEQLAFLTDPGVLDGQAIQTIIPNNATFQTEDLGTYDSDCDDILNAKSVLMANISKYGSDVI